MEASSGHQYKVLSSIGYVESHNNYCSNQSWDIAVWNMLTEQIQLFEMYVAGRILLNGCLLPHL